MLEQTLGNLSSHTNLSYGDHLYFGSSKLLTDKSLDGKKKEKEKEEFWFPLYSKHVPVRQTFKLDLTGRSKKS